MADVMEEGMALDVTAGLIQPLPREQKTPQKLVVEVSEDGAEHVLCTADGELLLIARESKDAKARVDIFIATGGDPPTVVGPAFSLVRHDGRHDVREGDVHWTLLTDKCECCAYLPPARASCAYSCRRELLRIKQYSEDIGAGNVICMEVELPKLRTDGSPELWCASEGGSAAFPEEDRLHLQSRKPRWNPKLKGLTLDFFGRCKQASVRNMQLVAVDPKRRQGVSRYSVAPEILFGKSADGVYVLDYKHPLGMAQAFAVALSSKDWR
jgi:hypothetical protein